MSNCPPLKVGWILTGFKNFFDLSDAPETIFILCNEWKMSNLEKLT